MSKHRSSRRIFRIGAKEPYGKPMGRSRSTVDRASQAPICQACAGEGGFPCPDCGEHQGRMYCGEGGCNAKNPGIRLCYACNGTGHDSQVGMARVKKASGPPPVDGPFLEVVKYLKRPDASQEYIRAALEPRRGWQYEEMLAVALANPNMPLDILPDFANFEDVYLKAFIDNPAIDIWTFENPALFWDMFKEEHSFAQGIYNGESELRIFGQGGHVYQQHGEYYSPNSEMQEKYRNLYLGKVIARIGEFDQICHDNNRRCMCQIELTASGVYIVRDRHYDSYAIDAQNMLWGWKNQYHGSVSASRMSSMKKAKKAPAKLRLADFLNSAKLREGDWQQIFSNLGVPIQESVGRVRSRQMVGRVGMALSHLEDPNATEQERDEAMKELLALPPEELLMSPHCPADVWWRLVPKNIDLAMEAPLFPLLALLEDFPRWQFTVGRVANQWIEANLNRLPIREQVRFAADCAERVLPIYEDQYPDDLRARDALQDAYDFVNGIITAKTLETNSYQFASGIDHTRGDPGDLSALAIRCSASTEWLLNALSFAIDAKAANAKKLTGNRSKAAYQEISALEAYWQWERLREYLKKTGV